MSQEPRFHAEYFIKQHLEELQIYAAVFSERIIRAFEDLETEAKRIQSDEYARLAALVTGPCDDDSQIAEMAYFKGVDYYLTMHPIRQGVINLMVAGLFHLFEQQAGSLARELVAPVQLSNSSYPWQQLKQVLHGMGVNPSFFGSVTLIEELRLIANTVKHGDGTSAEELRRLKPQLFEQDPLFPNLRTPLRPLVGEGLCLTNGHFSTYQASLEQFWHELTAALLPIFCPKT